MANGIRDFLSRRITDEHAQIDDAVIAGIDRLRLQSRWADDLNETPIDLNCLTPSEGARLISILEGYAAMSDPRTEPAPSTTALAADRKGSQPCLGNDAVREFFDATYLIVRMHIPQERAAAAAFLEPAIHAHDDLPGALVRAQAAGDLAVALRSLKSSLLAVQHLAPTILDVLRRRRRGRDPVSVDGWSFSSWTESTIVIGQRIVSEQSASVLCLAAVDEEFFCSIDITDCAYHAAEAVLKVPSIGFVPTDPGYVASAQQLEEPLVFEEIGAPTGQIDVGGPPCPEAISRIQEQEERLKSSMAMAFKQKLARLDATTTALRLASLRDRRDSSRETSDSAVPPWPPPPDRITVDSETWASLIIDAVEKLRRFPGTHLLSDAATGSRGPGIEAGRHILTRATAGASAREIASLIDAERSRKRPRHATTSRPEPPPEETISGICILISEIEQLAQATARGRPRPGRTVDPASPDEGAVLRREPPSNSIPTSPSGATEIDRETIRVVVTENRRAELRRGTYCLKFRGPSQVRLLITVLSQPNQEHQWKDILRAWLAEDGVRAEATGRIGLVVTSLETLRHNGRRVRRHLGELGCYWEQDGSGVVWRPPGATIVTREDATDSFADSSRL